MQAERTIWSFTATDVPLEAAKLPSFLRHHAGAVRPGDQILFTCGSNGKVVHGTLVVLEAQVAGNGEPAMVKTALMCRSPPP